MKVDVGVARGLQYLKEKEHQFVVCYIKFDNIIIFYDYVPKIADVHYSKYDLFICDKLGFSQRSTCDASK